jgi:hypothetical protein
MDSQTLTIAFDFERETKGAVRYQERGADIKAGVGAVGALYVRKSALEELAGDERAGGITAPQTLAVTIGASR